MIDIRDPETGERKRKWHSCPDARASERRRASGCRIITEMGNGAYAER